ncbi:MAG TPA: VOC family protein [Candidatus Binatia bacterium]|nr:VOC family protein [Candidatus Binatia bacterium]
MNWTLELIVVPVSDIDRAKAFYADRMGFNVDVDFSPNDDFRVVQLTPPGSAASITLLRNRNAGPDAQMEPGTLRGLHLIVPDIEAARAELVGRGTDVSDFFHFGETGQAAGLHPERQNYGTYASIKDPDGNVWLLQEVDRAKEEAHAEAVPAEAKA